VRLRGKAAPFGGGCRRDLGEAAAASSAGLEEFLAVKALLF